MENLDEAYAVADSIYEKYEALLWDLIKDIDEDVSLLKIANRLEEAREWEKN